MIWRNFAAVTLMLAITVATFSQTAAPDGSMTALTDSEDNVFARRMLMNTIGNNNDILHETFDGLYPYDPMTVSARLESISAMLRAFPHLYQAEPDQWSEEIEASDPAHVSLSAPALWDDFEGFYRLANHAAETAYAASRALSQAEQKALTNELEGQCEACHQAYRRELVYFELPGGVEAE